MEDSSVSLGKKFLYEITDMLAGSAFPFMLMLILDSTIISYAHYGDDVGLKIVVVIVGELLIAAAYAVFGRQNGITACKKTIQNGDKRKAGSIEPKVLSHTGEYAVWKGFVIPVISCIPFIVFQLIYNIYPNTVCDFVLVYAFGWAVFPFRLMKASDWLNFIWIIPLAGIHAAAYIIGSNKEKKNRKILEQTNEIAGKSGKK